MKRKKILYYINSPWPTDEQKARAEDIGASFRNVNYFDRPEQCDGVIGDVPDGYDKSLIISDKPKRGRPKKVDELE